MSVALKRLSILLTALALTSACKSNTMTAPAPAPTFPSPVPSNRGAYQADTTQDASFATLINGVRTSAGVAPLTYNAQLDRAAQAHAADMVKHNYFDHTGRDGSTVGDRVKAAGYDFRKVGENIAQGQQNEKAALDGWVKSPGHQRNNVDPDFENFGLGRAGTGANVRWVLVFGDPK